MNKSLASLSRIPPPTLCWALALSLSAPVAYADEIEATATTRQSQTFPVTNTNQQVSQTLSTVNATQSGPDPSFGHFESTSQTDLNAGALHGRAMVSNTNSNFLPGLVAEAKSRIDVNLTIVPLVGIPKVDTTLLPPGALPPGVPSGSIPIEIVLHAHGSFANLSGAGTANGSFELSTSTNVAPAGGYFTGNYMTISCSSPCNAAQISGGFPLPPVITTASTAPGAWEAALTITNYADPANSFLSLYAQLTATASSFGLGSATIDAFNTARIEVKLPAGYTFTSNSDFLNVSAVPEPAQAVLLSAGLLFLLGPALRKRRAIHAPPRKFLS